MSKSITFKEARSKALNIMQKADEDRLAIDKTKMSRPTIEELRKTLEDIFKELPTCGDLVRYNRIQDAFTELGVAREDREAYVHNRSEYRKEIENLEDINKNLQARLNMVRSCLTTLYNYKGDWKTFTISIGIILKQIEEE